MSLIGYAPGAYDMFHIGHLNILRRARSSCDHLIAGVVTDDVVVQAKSKHPVVPFEERLAIVASIRHVDEAVPDPFTDKFRAWERFGFHVLFKGDDWQGTARSLELESRLAAVEAEVVYFPYTKHISSTSLRSRVSVPT